MRRLLKPVLALAVLPAALACAPEAHAGLLPVKISVDPDSGSFRYTYNVILTSDSLLDNGDYFTIYDFDGLVEGSEVGPSGFEFSSELVGPTPEGLIPIDDPSVANLTWKYIGPATQIGQVGLGNFMANSIYDTTTVGYFTAQSHREIDGRTDNNITSTEIPVPSSPETPPVVPEPATLALVALGLPLVGAARLVRRRRAVGVT